MVRCSAETSLVDPEAKASIGVEDSGSDFMIATVVEVPVDYAEYVILQRAWLVGINDSIRKATLASAPDFQSPEVISAVPQIQPLAYVIPSSAICPKVMAEQRVNDLGVALRLLKQGQNLGGCRRVSCSQKV